MRNSKDYDKFCPSAVQAMMHAAVSSVPLPTGEHELGSSKDDNFSQPHRSRCHDCIPLQEAHHRIGNHFSLLNSFVRLRTGDLARQAREPDRAQVLLLLKVISVQIDTLARVHRFLASSDSGAALEIGAHLHECLIPFQSGLYGTVAFTEEFELGCLVQPERLLSISQIVAEVVTNAIKYGRVEESAIVVRCSKTPDDNLLIEVSDNGPGFPAGFDPLTSGGLGFRVLRKLSCGLGAQIDFESTSYGVHFRLSMPAKEASGQGQGGSAALTP